MDKVGMGADWGVQEKGGSSSGRPRLEGPRMLCTRGALRASWGQSAMVLECSGMLYISVTLVHWLEL